MPSDHRLGRARELRGTTREILQRLCDDLFFKCARRAALCRSHMVETQNGAKHARRRCVLSRKPGRSGQNALAPSKRGHTRHQIKQPAQLDSQKSGPHHARYQQLLRKLARRNRKSIFRSTTGAKRQNETSNLRLGD